MAITSMDIVRYDRGCGQSTQVTYKITVHYSNGTSRTTPEMSNRALHAQFRRVRILPVDLGYVARHGGTLTKGENGVTSNRPVCEHRPDTCDTDWRVDPECTVHVSGMPGHLFR